MRRAAPALSLGFILTLGSSFGQTFFISLFAEDIREAFGLTHGTLGGLYTSATLASAIVLLWLGKLTDRFDLSLTGALSLVGLSSCAMLMAGANSIIVLVIALFGLRLFGQGLMSHIAITAMGRWFSAERGRALSLAALGFPVGEALLPATAVFFLTLYTWHYVWLVASVSILVVMLPAFIWCSHRLNIRCLERPCNRIVSAAESSESPSWTRAQVLRDPWFYALLPGILAAPFIITGILFHQVHLVETKDWELQMFTSCYPLYAISATVVSLGAGPIIDRFSAVYLLRFYLVPLALGLALLASTDAVFAAPAFMLLMGASAGGATIMLGALWVELYGNKHLGAIRSLGVALIVLSTAIAPGVMGVLIDVGLNLNSQFGLLAVYLCLCVVVFTLMSPSFLVERRPPAQV